MKTYSPQDFTFAQLAERLRVPYDHAREILLAVVAGGRARLISGERKVRRYMWCRTNKLTRAESLGSK